MKLLGLTGNIACGKSTVASLLRERGAGVLDADKLVHELYSNRKFATQVAALFGGGVLDGQGIVDRKALSTLVFGDAAALRRLELLVHPAVAELRAEKLRAFEKQPEPPRVVVLEAVKLLESGQARDCAAVWYVTCATETQLQRLVEKRGLSEEQARVRLSSQPSHEAKQRLADAMNVPLVEIENDGTPQELATQVQNLWSEFVAGEIPVK